MLGFLIKYKKYIISLVIAIVLLLSFNWYVGRKESAAYDRGFESANVQWIKKGKEYVAMIDDEKSKNTALNYTLNLLSEGKLIEEQKKRDVIVKQQLEYSQSPEAKKHSLDDKFIKLYNDSLGE